ncbi:MAG: EscU/YscU/HrcU family type III secretion system export apparatus switch protein, partial [Campylobacterales bacterium]|nr:EscU/YscU/HrcU family type III secretion system export apparatus switch protein [Campylobacterales bacterium]
MADDDKTEEPTSKKIEDARKEGNVPKSQDTAGVITLFIAILAFLMLFSFISEHITKLFRYYLSLIGMDIDREFMVDIAIVTAKEVLLVVLPMAVSVAIGGILASVAQFGFLFTTDVLTPKFSKLNPINGIKNLISMKKLIEGIKITLKSFTVLGVGFIIFFYFIQELPTVALFGLADQLSWLKDKAIVLSLSMLMIIFIFAAIDLVITRKQYFDGLTLS